VSPTVRAELCGPRPPVRLTFSPPGTKLFPAIFTEVRKIHAWVAKWTTTKCENKFEFPSFPDDPDFPDVPPLPGGALYIC
jgi:hypothetical protein